MQKKTLLIASCFVLLLSSLFVLQANDISAIPSDVQANLIGGGASCASAYNCEMDNYDCRNYTNCDAGCPAGTVRCFDATRSYSCNGSYMVSSCTPWASPCYSGYVMTGECVNGACEIQGSAGTCPGRYLTDCIDM